MSMSLGDIKGQMILDVRQALKAYTAVRQDHVATVTALRTGGGAIAASGAIIAGAGTAMAGGLVAAALAAGEFERKIDFFGAVTNTVGKPLEQVSDKVLQLGIDSIYSAGQVADAFTDLAKAGVSAQEVMDGVGQAVINLGSATDMPLGEAATSLTTILNTFKISAEDAVGVVDKLAGAANSSSIEVTDLITTITYAGASAALLGVSFEDVNAAIAVLGEAGIKGSKAGTGLRQMFDKLAAPTKQGTEALRELGIVTDEAGNQLLDASGNMKSLPAVLDIINGSLEGYSASEKIDILGRIFPITSLPTIISLINGGSGAIARLNDEINKTTAADVAAKRLDNLSGDIEILKGNFETLAIVAGSSLQTFARGVVQGLTTIIQFFMDLSPAVQSSILVIIAITSAFLILVGGIGLFAGAIMNIVALAQVLGPAVSALVGYLIKAAGTMKLLWLAFAPPGWVGALIVIIGVIATALTYFFTQTEQGQAIWAQFMGVLSGAVAQIMPLLQVFAGAVGGFLVQALQTLLPILLMVGQFLLSVLQPVLAIIGPMLTEVAAAFSGVGSSASGLEGIGQMFLSIVDAVATALPIIINAVLELVIMIVLAIVNAIPQILAGAIQLFMGVVMAIVTVLPQIITALVGLITSLLTAIIGAIPMLIQAALQLFKGLVTGLVVALPIILQAVTTLLISIITALVTAIPMLLTAAIQLFQSLVEALPVILPLLLNGVIQLIMGVIMATIEAIPLLLEAAVQLFLSLVQALTEIIPMVISTTIELIPVIIGALISMIPVLIEGSITAFMAIVEALPEIIPPLFEAVIGLIPTIVEALISLIPQLIDAGVKLFESLSESLPRIIPKLVNALSRAGVQMIQGLIDGISSMVGDVMGAIEDAVGGAVDFAKSLLGIASPSKVFTKFGVYTIMGLINGIASQRRSLNQEMAVIVGDMTAFYAQVGAAAELDSSLGITAAMTATTEAPTLTAQINALNAQLQAIAEKDTFNIEKLEVNNGEKQEDIEESLPNAIRKTAFMVGA